MICPMIQEHSLLLKGSVISQVPEDAILKIRRPKKRCKLNLSTVSVLASRSLHQDLINLRSGVIFFLFFFFFFGSRGKKIMPDAFI